MIVEEVWNLLQITIPVISGLSIKRHALVKLRGLNWQFDICSCVRELILLYFNHFLNKNTYIVIYKKAEGKSQKQEQVP